MTDRPFRTRYLKLRSVLHDRNTGLPAFPMLFDRLRSTLDDRRILGVLHVELANLEMVESLYGWQVFDRIVARVAELLREAIGAALPADALLALEGVAGGRFVVFLPARDDGGELDAAWLGRTAQALAERLDRALEARDFVGLNPKICARVGQALLSDNPFFRFERCVYAAIDEARETPERRERRRELSWSEELEKIIRSAAVDVVFQPIVEIATRAVLGYEAYVRGPADSIFESPRAMFAMSERVGAAEKLDRVCCERALQAFASQVGEGRLFVNVLPGSFDDDEGPAAHLHAALDKAEMRPADLVLEFSERGVDVDPEPFCVRLERAKKEGFGIAIDDVGTGRAGMQAIERVRPDYLKLDTTLVRRIQDNLIQQEVLRTLVRLAHRVDAAVVGEGVETAAEAQTLAEGGARYAQGFHYAHPASARWDRSAAPRRRRATGGKSVKTPKEAKGAKKKRGGVKRA